MCCSEHQHEHEPKVIEHDHQGMQQSAATSEGSDLHKEARGQQYGNQPEVRRSQE